MPDPGDIRAAVRDYETWLGEHTAVVPADLELKHARMRESPGRFLRATCFRFAQLFAQRLPELARAPQVLACGDLHLENFGTWRDDEGRLVWGVNDWDEAARLPYAGDLVRLAASAHFAIEAGQVDVELREACAAILAGYSESLERGGRGFVLAERNRWLHRAFLANLDFEAFWRDLDALPSEPPPIPVAAARLLAAALPAQAEPRIVRRVAGLGSLGRPRYAALAEWRGGRLAREVKAIAPSAWVWAAGVPADTPDAPFASSHVYSPDPSLLRRGGWLVRRLAPDSLKIELRDMRTEHGLRLLEAMGFEAANAHQAARADRDALRADLRSRPTRWLRDAALAMAAATAEDFADWNR